MCDEVVDEMIMVSLTNSHDHDTSLEALQCIVMSGIVKHQPHSQLSTFVAYPSHGGNKGRLTLVQFNGLFNKTITPITRSTKRREGIILNENALKPQLIRLQLHIIRVHYYGI